MQVFERKRANASAILIGSLAAILIFTKSATAAYLQETRTISGYVQESKILHKPIRKSNGTQKSGRREGLSQVEVGIRGLGPTLTSDHGDFQLNIPATMKVGFPVTFYVTGWIVIDPSFSGEYGRVPLPAPELGPIPLRVARKGDKILLSDAGLRTLILGATANFKELAALQNDGRDASFQPSRSNSRCCRPYSSTKLITWSADDAAAIRARAFFLDWTKKRADKLGLSLSEVQAAVTDWIDRPRSDFDAGLGKLYQGRFVDAISLLTKAADHKQLRVEAQQAVAFAYGMQHDYRRAETFLQAAIEESGKLNPFLYINLGHTLILDGKRDEAIRSFETAAALVQGNGMKPQSQTVVPTPLPPSQTLECTVRITTPQADTLVQSVGTVEGIARLPRKGHLWVMIHRQGDDNWWPQSGGELALISGQWSVDVVYDVGETGRRLEVAAIVVNEQVDRSLVEQQQKVAQNLILPRPVRLPNVISGCPVAVLPVIYSGRRREDNDNNNGIKPESQIVAPTSPPPPEPVPAVAQTPSATCKVTVLTPQPGAKVDRDGRVRGTAEIPSGTYLWVLSHMKDMKEEWWPQMGRPASIDPKTKEWVIIVTYGRPQDVGEDFEVAVVVVDPNTNYGLRDWFRGARARDFPPLAFPTPIDGCSPIKIVVHKTGH